MYSLKSRINICIYFIDEVDFAIKCHFFSCERVVVFCAIALLLRNFLLLISKIGRQYPLI